MTSPRELRALALDCLLETDPLTKMAAIAAMRTAEIELVGEPLVS